FHPCPKSWTAESKGRDEASSQAAKQIVVVARDRQKLFEYAKRAFSGNSSVEVVLDRRRAERRTGERASSPDRRRGDRRLMNEIDNHLRARLGGRPARRVQDSRAAPTIVNNGGPKLAPIPPPLGSAPA